MRIASGWSVFQPMRFDVKVADFQRILNTLEILVNLAEFPNFASWPVGSYKKLLQTSKSARFGTIIGSMEPPL